MKTNALVTEIIRGKWVLEISSIPHFEKLFCIPKILKNESNSQRGLRGPIETPGCFVSQRY